MSQPTLSRWEEHQEAFANAEAEILFTLNLMPKKFPLEFNHGMTKTEVKEKFELLVKQGRFKKVLAVYDNKMRALFSKNLAGRHTVHGKRHYFALSLDEDGLVNHNCCEDCSVGESKTP